ncbi:hypothetical protein GGQ88_000113 [Novosphingobium hassiacum]|uniref:Bacteriophage tail tape measure N-terminal domain-containing protein n=1 Tax=Novosphingobium hassiacum TaxID=173676 RepID=A0A7W6EU35_9SPHN|nr:phage tail length tape measure family protein [Novosphingobium hassiacum]MBB3858873.1 hypothetical protein [Novosphingobium hassiacum]
MTLKTSLVIAGDTSGAVSALGSLDKSLAGAAAEAKRMEQAFAAADKQIEALAAAQARAAQETLKAKTAFNAGDISLQQYNARLLETKTGLSVFEAGHRNAVTALKQAQASLAGAKVSTGQAAAGYQNFGRQVQDVAVQIQGGANIGTIISQQGGQIADAVAQMGGRFAGLASFLAGPWGAALIVGTGLLVNLGIELYNSADAADANAKSLTDVKLATNGLSDAQSVLGSMFDLATGKIKAQNEMLRLNVTLTAIKLRAEASAERANSERTTNKFSQGNLGLSLGQKAAGALGIPVGGAVGRESQVRELVSDFRSGKVDSIGAAKRAAGLDFTGLSVSKSEFLQAISDGVSGPGKEKIANLIEKSLEKGQLDPTFREEKNGRNKRNNSAERERKAALAREEYGEGTAKKIADIRDQFSDLPTAVGRANNAMRDLDKISGDLARRPLTPNVKALVDEIGRAKAAINESLNRPFNDFLEQAREGAEIDKLLLAGRDDEARALQIVLGLQEKQGPLQQEQLDAVLATVRGERERSAVLRDQRALISANVAAVQDFRGALEGTVADALRGRFSIERVLSSIGNSFITITSKKLVENMFGDTLRQLEAQATGADKVDAAGTRIASSLDDGAKAVKSFADVVNTAIAAIRGSNGSSSATASLASVAGGAAGSVSDLFGKLTSGVAEKIAQNAGAMGSGGVPETSGDEIVVTANKSRKVDLSGTNGLLIDMVDRTLQQIGVRIPTVVTAGIKGALAKLEQSLPQALQGAFTGTAASRIFLGDKGTTGMIGSAIGGALGGKLGEQVLTKGLTAVGGKALGSLAGPLGSALGGVLGGLIGGAFKKTTSGGASIGLNAQGNAGVTGTAGNSADLKKTASGFGGTVVSALDQIAQALGADLGAFNVAIGKRSSGYIKVSASGNAAATTGKKVTSDIIYNGKDEGEAIMAALANAIGDGAIKGVSAAVQRALKSSTDVDKAVKEALKVQQVELAIGGIGAEMAKAFSDFERQAAERLKIARQYGFDVAKLEQVNAKDRLKLNEKLLKEQVGSLQDLIAEMTSGSLFEGSSVDQRAKLLDQISATRAQAAAGEEGAADKLAQLLQQLNSVSRDAFGTTGGFAADRSTILDVARETVAAANQRIADAQKATDPALAETNGQLDEANDQLSRLAALTGESVEYLRAMSNNLFFTGFGNLAATAGFR